MSDINSPNDEDRRRDGIGFWGIVNRDRAAIRAQRVAAYQAAIKPFVDTIVHVYLLARWRYVVTRDPDVTPIEYLLTPSQKSIVDICERTILGLQERYLRGMLDPADSS